MKRNFGTSLKKSATAAALGVLIASTGSPVTRAQVNREKEKTLTVAIKPLAQTSQTPAPTQSSTTQSKFYCNPKALNSEERTRHQKLTEKLMAMHPAVVESDKGYEFQFTPASTSLAELVDWATTESKCCPFFDFHLDLENEGKLLCLRLTGEQGIKPFIRAEFHVPAD